MSGVGFPCPCLAVFCPGLGIACPRGRGYFCGVNLKMNCYGKNQSESSGTYHQRKAGGYGLLQLPGTAVCAEESPAGGNGVGAADRAADAFRRSHRFLPGVEEGRF